MYRFYRVAFVTLALAMVVLSSRSRAEGLQGYLCELDRCTLQDWISALSGWAGFLAALIGAWLVFAQLAEQRKQTAFALGDGKPSLDVFMYSIKGAPAVLRIVNWNRRLLHIRHISLVSEYTHMPSPKLITFFHPIFRARASRIDVDFKEDGWLASAVAVEGWLDHQSSPHVGDFSLLFERVDGSQDFTTLLEGVKTSAVVTIKLYGTFDEGPQAVRLSLTVPIIDLLPNTIKRAPLEANP